MLSQDPATEYLHFPQELKDLPQWCAAGAGGAESKTYKAPIDPHTGRFASVADPTTWGTFEQARAMGLPLVGFMFSKSDPYAVIDLDTYKAPSDEVRSLHTRILLHAASYVETSQSGLGSHIICRGSIPEGARNDENAVEIYSDSRFMVCTGNTYNPRPIIDEQELLDSLYKQMKKKTAGQIDWRYLERGQELTHTDTQLLECASNAANGEKFDRLWAGNMSDYGYDHSRADCALIQFLCFYTLNNEQVARLFLMSKLAERDKATRRDYVPRTIARMRARLADEALPPINAGQLIARAKSTVAATARTIEPATSPSTLSPLALMKDALSFPSGLVGETGKYVLAAATRPVHEIALATGIAIIAGIAGRQFNISTPPTGLNQYILLLAATGTGKESIHTTVDRLFHEVQKTVPAADFVGPAKFASGPALVRQFGKRPCFLSVMGEFGSTIQQMSDPRGNPSDRTLNQVMLDVFSKSGFGQILRSSVYSDSIKDTSEVISPSLTILGESAPESFFDHLSESQITSGFLPRFLLIEYKGDRPPRNRHALAEPPLGLVKQIADLCVCVLHMMQNNTRRTVDVERDALVLLDAFDEEVDYYMIGSREVMRHLWNRSHLKALRLAALLAVGVNPHAPAISHAQAAWAIDLVRRDANILVARFASGDVGGGESKQQADIVGIIQRFLREPNNRRFPGYAERGCIPKRFIHQSVTNRPAFRLDKRGSGRALRDTLADMISIGQLQLVPAATAAEWFKTAAVTYCLGDTCDA